MKKYISTLFCAFMASAVAFGGNPDRQGQAGAYELLLNPWARTTGLNMLNVSSVKGAEAANLNVAGLGRINKTEVALGHAIYLRGTGLSLNALSLAQKVGENGVMGISLNSVSFGKIPITTTGLPEGTGATFSPTFFNLGASYAHQFEKKVSVGVTLRLINESLADVSAFGFSMDAGVQYMTGSETYPERFKFGIALRNVGSRMRFGGQGLNHAATNPDGTLNYALTYSKQAAEFELPTQLHIGAAYDVLPEEKMRLTAMVNFTSNAFSRDEVGGGLEFNFNNLIALRGSYKYEVGTTSATLNRSVHTGIAGGLTVNIPVSKLSSQAIALDYGYQHTRVWDGTHTVGLRIQL
jgi:hypothetical protein